MALGMIPPNFFTSTATTRAKKALAVDASTGTSCYSYLPLGTISYELLDAKHLKIKIDSGEGQLTGN